MSAFGSWLRWIALSLLVVTLGLGVVTLRVISEGTEERIASDQAFDRGDLSSALVHARRAAVLYAPGAPHIGPAYDRMVAIALGSERQGNSELAEQAWRAVRSALIETQHLWIVDPTLLTLANGNLARLMTQGESELAGSRSEAQTWLDRHEAPGATWVLVLGLGFVSTAIGLCWICVRGVDSGGGLCLGRIKWAGLLTLIGLACWTLAVLRA